MPGRNPKPQITVTPNPMPEFTKVLTIAGSGFRPLSAVQVGLFGLHPQNGVTDDAGTFSVDYAPLPGGIEGPIVGNELVAYAYGFVRNKGIFLTLTVIVA